MPIDLDSAFGSFAKTMALRSRRAEVLAANIANADTPNYKAQDLDFKATLQQAQAGGGPLKVSHPHHLQPGQANGVPGGAGLKFRVPQTPSLDGNTVDIQTEKSEFARNALEYQVSMTLLGKRISGLRAAIKGE